MTYDDDEDDIIELRLPENMHKGGVQILVLSLIIIS